MVDQAQNYKRYFPKDNPDNLTVNANVNGDNIFKINGRQKSGKTFSFLWLFLLFRLAQLLDYSIMGSLS